MKKNYHKIVWKQQLPLALRILNFNIFRISIQNNLASINIQKQTWFWCHISRRINWDLKPIKNCNFYKEKIIWWILLSPIALFVLQNMRPKIFHCLFAMPQKSALLLQRGALKTYIWHCKLGHTKIMDKILH